jgi:hypothetical protein
MYGAKRSVVISDEEGLGRSVLVAAFLHIAYSTPMSTWSPKRKPTNGPNTGVHEDEDNDVHKAESDAVEATAATLAAAPITGAASPPLQGEQQPMPQDQQPPKGEEVPPTLPQEGGGEAPPKAKGPPLPAFLVIVAHNKLETIEKEIQSWTGRAPILYHGTNGVAEKRRCKDTDLLFGGEHKSVSQAPIVITTLTSITTLNPNQQTDLEIRDFPWAGIIWMLESVMPWQLSARRGTKAENLLLKKRANTLDKVRAVFSRAGWWMMVRRGIVGTLATTATADPKPSRPIRFPLGCNAGNGVSDFPVTSYRHPDTDYTDVIPLTATAGKLIPARTVLPKWNATCVTTSVNRLARGERDVIVLDTVPVHKHMAQQVAVAEAAAARGIGRAVATPGALSVASSSSSSSSHMVQQKPAPYTTRNVYAVIAEGVYGQELPRNVLPSVDPTQLPIEENGVLMVEELWLFMAFLYPNRYPTLTSLEAALKTENLEREHELIKFFKVINGTYTAPAVPNITASISSSSTMITTSTSDSNSSARASRQQQYPASLATAYEVAKADPEDPTNDDTVAFSPFSHSVLDPMFVPVLSRGYTQTVVSYLRRIPRPPDSMVLSLTRGMDPGGCTISTPQHRTIGRVQSITASITLTPLQTRVLLRVLTGGGAVAKVQRAERTSGTEGICPQVDPDAGPDGDEEENEPLDPLDYFTEFDGPRYVMDLMSTVRRASADAGLVEQGSGGQFGARLDTDDSAYADEDREEEGDRSVPPTPLAVQDKLDAKRARSLAVADLCASSGKLEYLRTLFSTRVEGGEHKPVMILAQARDSCRRIAALLRGMGISYSMVDPSSDSTTVHKETSAFVEPALFGSSSFSDAGAREKASCDVLIVGSRLDAPPALAGLGAAVRRAELFLLYDGVCDQLGVEAETKMIRTIHTLKNVTASATSSSGSINVGLPGLASETDSVTTIIRMIVADSIETVLVRGMRDLSSRYSSDDSTRVPIPKAEIVSDVAPVPHGTYSVLLLFLLFLFLDVSVSLLSIYCCLLALSDTK